MRKVAAITAVLTVGLGTLTACSGGDKAYCNELKANENATKAGTGDVKSTIDTMKKVRDKAPSEVKDDWDVLIDYLQKLEDAKGDPTKAGDIAGDAGKTETAAKNISKHAKDSCNIDLPT
jgi:hypothetical protein